MNVGMVRYVKFKQNIIMKVEQVKTPDDIERYVEGCINDFEGAISDKDETVVFLCELVVHIYKEALKEKCAIPDVIHWVAIKELPTVDCFYLVYDREDGMISKALFDGEFHIVEDMVDNNITHWAHLPKPPYV